MQQYYIAKNNEQQGPYSIEELKTLSISSETNVWKEGMENWDLAKNVSELNPLFIKNVKQDKRSKKKFALVVLSVLFVLIVVGLIFVFMPKGQTDAERVAADKAASDARVAARLINEKATADSIAAAEKAQKDADAMAEAEASSNNQDQSSSGNQKATIKQNILSYVIASNSDYEYRRIGGIYNLSMFIENKSPYKINFVQVVVQYIQTNGEVHNEKAVEFKDIEPGEKMQMPVEDNSRGTKINYYISMISSKSLDLCYSNLEGIQNYAYCIGD